MKSIASGIRTAVGVQDCTLVRFWGTNGVQVPQNCSKFTDIHKKKESSEDNSLL